MPRKLITTVPLDERQRYTINETCDYLRCSRDYLYKLIREGEVPIIKDGCRTYVGGKTIAKRSAPPQ